MPQPEETDNHHPYTTSTGETLQRKKADRCTHLIDLEPQLEELLLCLAHAAHIHCWRLLLCFFLLLFFLLMSCTNVERHFR
jgi:hypothetical protein